MIFRFTMISDEVDDFIREFKIDSDATFYDLHQLIFSSCNYREEQITSFFLCDENWERKQEVVLEDMGTSMADEDLYIMRNTTLNELLEDEKQRMVYLFDPLNERMFFMELSEIIFGENLETSVCSRQNGVPPLQNLEEESFLINQTPVTKSAIDLDEEFYGDEEFDAGEFDPEGFDFSEEKSS